MESLTRILIAGDAGAEGSQEQDSTFVTYRKVEFDLLELTIYLGRTEEVPGA